MKRSGDVNAKIKNKFKYENISELTKEKKDKYPDKNKEIFEFADELLKKITNVNKSIDGKHKKCVSHGGKFD